MPLDQFPAAVHISILGRTAGRLRAQYWREHGWQNLINARAAKAAKRLARLAAQEQSSGQTETEEYLYRDTPANAWGSATYALPNGSVNPNNPLNTSTIPDGLADYISATPLTGPGLTLTKTGRISKAQPRKKKVYRSRLEGWFKNNQPPPKVDRRRKSEPPSPSIAHPERGAPPRQDRKKNNKECAVSTSVAGREKNKKVKSAYVASLTKGRGRRRFVRMKREKVVVCGQCGGEFAQSYVQSKTQEFYCSGRCRMAGVRAEHARVDWRMVRLVEAAYKVIQEAGLNFSVELRKEDFPGEAAFKGEWKVFAEWTRKFEVEEAAVSPEKNGVTETPKKPKRTKRPAKVRMSPENTADAGEGA